MRKLCSLIPLLAAATLASSAAAQLTNPIGLGTQHIYLDTAADAGSATLDMAVAPAETNRAFFITQGGTVRVYKNNTLLGDAYVNIASHVSLVSTGERGLLGWAFHPQFNTAGSTGFGKFYTYTSETKAGDADFTHPEIGLAGGDHHSVIREWTVNPSLDALTGTPTNRILMKIAQPQANHNGGALRFGNDDLLYISLGDGGGGNDNSGGINAPTDGHTNETGNAQDITNVYGKILRINPLDPDGGGALRYSVPSDNPFVPAPEPGQPDGVNEVFAYGLRNPFRMNFDRPTGRLYTADVGQGAREEVSVILTPTGPGQPVPASNRNYGWVYMEGTRVNRTPPAGFTSTAPIGEYTSGDGHSVMGGFVYHGSIPELQGRYVFGDYNGNAGVGRLFHMPANGGAGTIQEFRYDGTTTTGSLLYGWGEDAQGELYALFADGTVKRLIGADAWRLRTGGAWDTAANWTSGTRDGTTGVWTGAAPNAPGAAARFLNGPTAPATITLSAAKTVGSLTFSNANRYTIAGSPTLSLDVATGLARVDVMNGSHTIGTSQFQLHDNTLFQVGPAASTLSITSALLATNVSVSKEGAGVLEVNNVRAQQLTITEGTLKVVPNGGATGVSKVTGLHVATLGTLHLGDNDLLVDYLGTDTPYATLRGYVLDGVDGAGGIVTTPGGAPNDRGLALAEATDLPPMANWLGQPIDDTTVIGKYTYYGDANLDGRVTSDDYVAVDVGLGIGTRWSQGDFNYSGTVTSDDYVAIDVNLGKGSPTPLAWAELKAAMIALHMEMFGAEYVEKLALAEAEGFAALVPEPGAFALLGAAAGALLKRRRV